MSQMVNIDLRIQSLPVRSWLHKVSPYVWTSLSISPYSQGIRQVVAAKPSQIWGSVCHLSQILSNSISCLSLENCCRPDSLDLCPPYHVSINGTKIYREDTTGFPYSAYHLYCSPPNAAYAESPAMACDPYSNPQAQEIVQLLPHPEWAVHGYPTKQGDGWVGDSRTWTLDVGALSNCLYFYQVP